MDNNPLKNEDEYHFSESENTNVFGSGSSIGGPNSRRRNILLTLGVIIVLLAVYKLLGVIFSPSAKKTKTIPPVTLSKPVAPPVNTMPALPSAPAVSGPDINQLNNAVSQRIDKVEGVVSQNSSILSDIQSKINDLNNSLQTLANELTQQQAQLTALQAAQQKPKIEKKPPVIQRKVYYIQAMVPGRAWLKATIGETKTVKIGDYLPGYGAVQLIDTSRGIVATSSGIVIGYSPEES